MSIHITRRSALQRLRIFRADTEGSGTVEAVIILPMLLWWFITSFQFFEAFKEKNVNIKAAFTLADTVTRQNTDINMAFINGLDAAFAYLITSDETSWIRVTSIKKDVTTEQLEVMWSKATDSKPAMDNAMLDLVKTQIPVMNAGDSVILVETHSSFEPVFNIGLNDMWFDQFVVMRPRFKPEIGFN